MDDPRPYNGTKMAATPANAELTRARILTAGLELFAARGFKGTTTRALASAAGCNIATLAWHFQDKRGAYEAVLDSMYEELLAWSPPEALPADPAGRVRALVLEIWTVMRARRDHVRLLQRHVLEEGRLPERVRERWTPVGLARAMELVAALDLPSPPEPLLLLDLNHLISRYVLSEAQDLRPFTGPGDPHAVVVAHLQDLCVALLLPGPARPS